MVKIMSEQDSAPETSFYLGFDGGGTKTDCILMDAEANVLARATAGPSNPLRAGYAKAWFTLSDAADVVLEPSSESQRHSWHLRGHRRRRARVCRETHRHFSRARVSRSRGYRNHRSGHHP